MVRLGLGLEFRIRSSVKKVVRYKLRSVTRVQFMVRCWVKLRVIFKVWVRMNVDV